MEKFESLNRTKWDCKFHIVFIPQNHMKVLYGQLRVHIRQVFHGLAHHKEGQIEEGCMLADHVNMLIQIPPKYAVSNVEGDINGGNAILLDRVYGKQIPSFTGQSF